MLCEIEGGFVIGHAWEIVSDAVGDFDAGGVDVLGLSVDGDEVPCGRSAEAILDEERGSGHVSVALPGELVEACIVAIGHQIGGGRDGSHDARRHRDSQFSLEGGGDA